MGKLILIKHSRPSVISNVPANQWHLSEEGRRRCKPLADSLSEYSPDVIVTSIEPKAIETGHLIAEALQRSVQTAQGLHEHPRSKDDWFDDIQGFNEAVQNFFENPDSLVFGSETADQAHRRFSEAVTQVVDGRQEQTTAVVTHGTVLTLFFARLFGLNEFTFWKELGLPSYVVISLPGYGLEKVVKNTGRTR